MNIRRKRKSFFIPLFSMSDIAFLLLIFIMLVSLINYRKEIKIDYPRAQTAQRTSAEKNLEVWINLNGGVFLDGEKSSAFEFEKTISALYAASPNTRVHIIADRNTSYENVNSVLEVMQKIQYPLVSFAVKDNE